MNIRMAAILGFVGAGGLGVLGQFDRFAGGVGARSGDHRNASVDLVDHAADHFDVLGHAQGGRLTGGTDSNDCIGAFLQMEIHQLAQAVPVQTALRIHGRDQRHHTARNHATTPAGINKKRRNGTRLPSALRVA